MIAVEAAAAAAALQSIDPFVTDSQEAGEKVATLLLHIFFYSLSLPDLPLTFYTHI